ncbi:hypothetical protein AAZX31_06G085200 [Glycine max]|uniref:Epidermal patterning factor-like protein n=2 Tax=Glycine subgen. Soja TaxID=1462606 RepID=I1K9I6_SOYBN|nr:EPIDERMAL PATTERNING FACTOR-like protein 2 [Glycine max]XP_028235578.1 EPIDERMAL PATTERNING FACTOR-like protein 2 [Glycine soja]KAG5018828.1 hypothetical protein JHK87_014683 [Glycine soja]KAH1124910.1 hypothetical protein GYH30_014516 [Glycine max]KAH1245057.1 EPIDERMAL PATTERNING FACTOR-like protein 2 [Glycine max]KHN37202.1 EPIDERMAL PATTERNING FACTOR-like protein 2 [Glycine soja]KRH52825.1 hypothetical protein GLYMA_06G089200v4 [Glycine max]|eukprot:XP_003526510.2 EPIDERMAL PATTERNING FACTOR-like protein 2 [Glycine max]
MGITQVCVSCHKYRQITFICLILFAIVFTTQGRTISSFVEVAPKEMRIMVAKPRIGSRPPKCEKRCSSCGHCEAVQVPVVPQIFQTHRRRHYSSERATKAVTYSSRGDDLSNYKPMSWKCKCGDYLFNP